ncbi:hypothetical protein QOT17_008964 [Balamuthia mandrillaris]
MKALLSRTLLLVTVVFTVYRLFAAVFVDAAAGFGCEIALEEAQQSCTLDENICVPLCELRTAIGLSLKEYFAVDKLSESNCCWPLRLLFLWAGFVYTPFLVYFCVCSIFKKSSHESNVRLWKQGIVMTDVQLSLLVGLLLAEAFGPYPSPNLGLFMLYNLGDFVFPFVVIGYCWLSLRSSPSAVASYNPIKTGRKK